MTTYPFTITVTDKTGKAASSSGSITSSGGTTFPDGSANAPTGTPQYPTLLNGYAKRPPWKVAGVEYRTGRNTTVPLTDWQSLGSKYPGHDVSTVTSFGHFYLRINNASNLVISGIDFSLHGGCSLYLFQCSNITVEDCNFAGTPAGSAVIDMDPGGQGHPSFTGLVVRRNIFDYAVYAGGSGIGSLVWVRNGGAVTLEYNWFKNFPNQCLFYSSSGNNGVVLYQYNVIENGGMFRGTAPSYSDHAHCNYMQFGGWDNGSTQVTVQYNTTIQHPQNGGPGEGFQFYDNANTNSMTFASPVLANNTMLALKTPAALGPGMFTPPLSTSMSSIVHGTYPASQVTGSPKANDNYFDPSGTYSGGDAGAFYPGSFTTNHGALGPAWALTNNVNMTNGHTNLTD